MYIEDLLEKKLMFEFKQVGLKWGVFERVKREDVTMEVGCVFIGDVTECRKYVQDRRSQQAIAVEERKGHNPFIIKRGFDGVIG